MKAAIRHRLWSIVALCSLALLCALGAVPPAKAQDIPVPGGRLYRNVDYQFSVALPRGILAYRMRLIFVWVIFLAAVLGAPAAMAGYVASLNQFLTAYHCPLFTALEQIHAHAMTRHDRFLVLEPEPGRGYVQCLFMDQDTRILCEASSGFYEGPAHRPIPKAALYAIARQGFSMGDRDGNFQIMLPVTGPASLWNAADIMLETLYRGQGARLGRRMVMHAPFVVGSLLLPGDGRCAVAEAERPSPAR